MLVLGINRLANWVQITAGRGRYTCPIKEINGELFFKFKGEWHRVIEYVSDLTTEMLSKEGKTIIQNFKK